MQPRQLSPFLSSESSQSQQPSPQSQPKKLPGTTAISSDQEIQIIPITAVLPATESAQASVNPLSSAPVPVSFDVDDLMILSDSVINTLPCAIWSKLPPIPEEKVKAFNLELYKYCVRKGIDPRDYLFDEFGLVMTGVGIAATHWDNYQQLYGKGAKEKASASNDPGTAAFDHAKEIAAQAEPKKDGCWVRA